MSSLRVSSSTGAVKDSVSDRRQRWDHRYSLAPCMLPEGRAAAAVVESELDEDDAEGDADANKCCVSRTRTAPVIRKGELSNASAEANKREQSISTLFMLRRGRKVLSQGAMVDGESCQNYETSSFVFSFPADFHSLAFGTWLCAKFSTEKKPECAGTGTGEWSIGPRD